MNQRQLSREPEVYTFREQKILDYLVFLNEHYPTASRYPVRLLRIKENESSLVIIQADDGTFVQTASMYF